MIAMHAGTGFLPSLGTGNAVGVGAAGRLISRVSVVGLVIFDFCRIFRHTDGNESTTYNSLYFSINSFRFSIPISDENFSFTFSRLSL